jgi:hypothetical protein
LHALGAPPAFVLSQDQTLQRTVSPEPSALHEGRLPAGNSVNGLIPKFAADPE